MRCDFIMSLGTFLMANKAPVFLLNPWYTVPNLPYPSKRPKIKSFISPLQIDYVFVFKGEDNNDVFDCTNADFGSTVLVEYDYDFKQFLYLSKFNVGV